MADDKVYKIIVHDKDTSPEMVGQEYCAILIACERSNGLWYNTGLVVRASTALAAFSEVLLEARYRLGDKF